jgi:hypothetical protein
LRLCDAEQHDPIYFGCNAFILGLDNLEALAAGPTPTKAWMAAKPGNLNISGRPEHEDVAGATQRWLTRKPNRIRAKSIHSGRPRVVE